AGRDFGAAGDEASQLLTLRLGHREPEERANLQRARVFFQFSCTQLLGRVGRQPKCALTESMPSATLSSWMVLISSGVTIGSDSIASMTVAPGSSTAIGSFSFGFLIPRAWMNQSNIASYVTTSGPPSSTILPFSSGLA